MVWQFFCEQHSNFITHLTVSEALRYQQNLHALLQSKKINKLEKLQVNSEK